MSTESGCLKQKYHLGLNYQDQHFLNHVLPNTSATRWSMKKGLASQVHLGNDAELD